MGTEISPSSPSHGGTTTHGSPLDFNSPSHPLHPSFHPRVDRTSLTARNTARRARGTRGRAGTHMSAYEGFQSAQDLVFENSTGEVVRKLAKMNKRSRNKMMYGRVKSLSPKGAYCRMCVGEFSRCVVVLKGAPTPPSPRCPTHPSAPSPTESLCVPGWTYYTTVVLFYREVASNMMSCSYVHCVNAFLRSSQPWLPARHTENKNEISA